MRRMTLIRCGAATVLLGGVIAAGAFAGGCDDNHSSGPPGVGDDSGTLASQPPAGDDGSLGDGAAGPVPGKIILVHASSFAPALRFCFGSVTGVDADGGGGRVTIVPGLAAPNTVVGVPNGTGGPVAGIPDVENRTLEIFAINAAKITGQIASDAGGELACADLIGSQATPVPDGGLGLVQGTDYWDLGRLPAGTLADGTTTLIAVTGCAPGDSNPNDALLHCPSPYDVATGNLGMWITKLDTTTPLDGGSIGAQFAYASYPFSAASRALAGGVAAVAGFYVTTTFTPDGGAPVTVPAAFPIAEGVTYGNLAPTTLVPVSGVTFDGTSGFFVNSVTDAGGPTPFQVPIPLPSIQALSYPGVDAGIFANGVGYVFVLVGDPTLPSFVVPDGGDAGEFNLFSVHILGFPTNPPVGN
jgi:hypothetical protein